MSTEFFHVLTLLAEGLAQWLRSMRPNPEVPGSIPGLVEGWLFGWPSFPLKFTQLSILPGSVKWVPAYMDRFEAAARGAYICFRSAGGKLIIVKRLWACYMEKALYKCTTLLYFTLLEIMQYLYIHCTRAFSITHTCNWRAWCKNSLSDDFGPTFTKPLNYLLSCNVTVAKWIVSCSQHIVLVIWIEFPPKLYQVTLLLARKVKLPKMPRNSYNLCWG